MKSLLCFLLLLSSDAILGQSQRRPAGRPEVPPSRELQPGPRAVAPPVAAAPNPRTGQPQPPALSSLTSNVTLALSGSLLGLAEIDFVQTGCGPRFAGNMVGPAAADASAPGPILMISATVTEDDGIYRVEYELGARVALPSSSMQGPGGRVVQNIEYRDTTLSGTILVTPGRQVVLSRVNGKSLTLCISPLE